LPNIKRTIRAAYLVSLKTTKNKIIPKRTVPAGNKPKDVLTPIIAPVAKQRI
jgi:hypothetical protein